MAVVSTTGTVSGTSGDRGGHNVSILCRSRLQMQNVVVLVFGSYLVLLLDNLVFCSGAWPGVEGDEMLALHQSSVLTYKKRHKNESSQNKGMVNG